MAGAFEALAQGLRALVRVASRRSAEPTAAIFDSRTLRSTPESGPQVGYDEAKRKRDSKLLMAVDSLGHLRAVHVTPANVDDRAEVGKLAATVQQATGDSIEFIYVEHGYTGENGAEAAKAQGVELYVVKLAEAKKRFVLLPKRWVVERSFAWAGRCRCLVKDYVRYAQTLEGLHFVAFAFLMEPQNSFSKVHNTVSRTPDAECYRTPGETTSHPGSQPKPLADIAFFLKYFQSKLRD